MISQASLWGKALVLATTLSFGSSAFALVDVQVEHGRRWTSQESNGQKSNQTFQQTMIAAHLSLLPFVAVGGSVSYFDVTAHDKTALDLSSSNGTEFGLDILANLSFVPVITPFVRLNLPLVSTFSEKYKGGGSVDTEGVPFQSYWYTVGAKYSLVPLVAISAEMGSGVSMRRATDGKDSSGNKFSDLNSSFKNRKATKTDEFLVGVEVGF